MWTIYKPNKSNTGSLLTVSFNSKSFNPETKKESEGAAWFNVVKQNGWNAESSTGTFKDGEKINVKFSLLELGGMINAIRNVGEPFKFFHGFGDSKVSGQFGYWEKDAEKGKINGFGLSVNRGEEKFKVSLSTSEAATFLVWLEYASKHIFDGLYSIAKANAEAARNTTKETPKKPAAKKAVAKTKPAPEPEPEETEEVEETTEEVVEEGNEDTQW